jgi:branched-subunit amino acid permease
MTQKESLLFWSSLFAAVLTGFGLLSAAVLLTTGLPWWSSLLPLGAWALGWLGYCAVVALVWYVIARMLD